MSARFGLILFSLTLCVYFAGCRSDGTASSVSQNAPEAPAPSQIVANAPGGNGEGYAGGNSAEEILNAEISRIAFVFSELEAKLTTAIYQIGEPLNECPLYANPSVCNSLKLYAHTRYEGRQYLLANLSILKEFAQTKYFSLINENFQVQGRLVLARTKLGSGRIEVSVPLLLTLASLDRDGTLIRQTLIHEMIHSVATTVLRPGEATATVKLIVGDDTVIGKYFTGPNSGAKFCDYIGAMISYYSARLSDYKSVMIDLKPTAYYPLNDEAGVLNGNSIVIKDISSNGVNAMASGYFFLGQRGNLTASFDSAFRLRREGQIGDLNLAHGSLVAPLALTSDWIVVDMVVFAKNGLGNREQTLFSLGQPGQPNSVEVSLKQLGDGGEQDPYVVFLSGNGHVLKTNGGIMPRIAARLSFTFRNHMNLRETKLWFNGNKGSTPLVEESAAQGIAEFHGPLVLGGGTGSDVIYQHVAVFESAVQRYIYASDKLASFVIGRLRTE